MICNHIRLLKNNVSSFSPHTMKWALSSSALLLLLETQRILTELLPHFSGPVQESVSALEGLEYR